MSSLSSRPLLLNWGYFDCCLLGFEHIDLPRAQSGRDSLTTCHFRQRQWSRQCGAQQTCQQVQRKLSSVLSQDIFCCRIPLKTVSKPPTLPQGRSRQKMVENIMKTKVSRSHSVPASSRPPFTSFSTSPNTPSAVKKGDLILKSIKNFQL